MRNILIIGAGKSTPYIVKYLMAKSSDENLFLTIGDLNLNNAKKLSTSHTNFRAIKFDILNRKNSSEQISKSDIVISMLPARFHVLVAKECLKYKKSLLTASYISDEMNELDKEVKSNGIIFMNEIGLDPGIDHFFSHLLVDKLKKTNLNNLDVTYHSYCGGFPSIPNDFKYKFSWSPVGVIKALNNDAKFVKNFKTVTMTPYKNVGKYSVNNEIYEAYPNRDSTPYIEEYNFDRSWNIQEFVRGTLRLNGWENAWFDIFKMLDDKSPELDKQIDKLGTELWEKHPYKQDEQDRVVLFVKLLAHHNKKEVFNGYYFLDEKGSGENTAMGNLVSITLSCAIDLILENKLKTGIQAAPHDENLINYFFKTFEEYKIVIKNNL